MQVALQCVTKNDGIVYCRVAQTDIEVDRGAR